MTATTRLSAATFAFALAVTGAAVTGQTQAPGGRMQTGITVHGRWTVDVRNPDGTLVSHTEFDNALNPTSGAALLAGLLNGEYVPGFWYVNLDGTPSAPCSAGAGTTICTSTEPGAPVSEGIDSTVFLNLERTVPRGFGGRPAGTMTLAGFVKVTNPASGLSITSVATSVSLCGGDTSPAGCWASGLTLGLTSHALATPIPVALGQIVQVRVALSFS